MEQYVVFKRKKGPGPAPALTPGKSYQVIDINDRMHHVRVLITNDRSRNMWYFRDSFEAAQPPPAADIYHAHIEDIEENWESFWKGIVCNPDGSINQEKVKKELYDFSYIMDQVPKVYCHITGDILSKLMYPAETVISVADEHFQKVLEREMKEAAEEDEQKLDPMDEPMFPGLPDISDATPEEKMVLLTAVMKVVSPALLNLFMAIGCKTHIEQIVVSDATDESFLLSFRKIGAAAYTDAEIQAAMDATGTSFKKTSAPQEVEGGSNDT